MEKISLLYPQYKPCLDRRQVNMPVALERRSGRERRANDRVALDSRLTRDIFQVKAQVNKLEKIAPSLFSQKIAERTPVFSGKNNLTKDVFVKSVKPDITEIMRKEAKFQEKADNSFKIGVLSAALTGAIAVSFLGAAGAVIALGSALYVGSKIFKNVVENEMKDK